jgi:site-specific DNA recombinase
MRVAIYARVSTQRQAQAQTIDQQLERLQAYARQQSWQVPAEHIFRDDGYSGSGLNRPGLDRLRDKIIAMELDRVLITAPDRLARNYVHQMVLIEEFEKYGCQVEFLDRPMSQDPHDQLVLQIRGAVAEYERTLIAERMRRGRQARYRAGVLLPWSQPPYGYQTDPEHPRDPSGVKIKEPEAAVIREMFAFYLQEATSLMGLVKHLKKLEIASPTGDEVWNVATVRGVLTNPAYTGKVYACRTRPAKARLRRSATHSIGKPSESRAKVPEEEWIPVATIPAIIEPVQFEQVKEKLSHNQQFARRNNVAHPYLLRALVSCGVCNLACTGRQLHPGYQYYVCSGKNDWVYSHLEQRCPVRYIPASQLDELVWKDLCELMTHPEIIIEALQRAQAGAWLPQELQARRENLRRGQVALQNQLERLTEAYLHEIIPLAEYQRRRAELERKQQGLEEQEKQLTQQVHRQNELAGLVTSLEAFCHRVHLGLENASFEQKRRLVELLIDRVVVKDGDVEIRYVFPTTQASETIRFCHLRKDYFDLPAASGGEHHPPGFFRGAHRLVGQQIPGRLPFVPRHHQPQILAQHRVLDGKGHHTYRPVAAPPGIPQLALLPGALALGDLARLAHLFLLIDQPVVLRPAHHEADRMHIGQRQPGRPGKAAVPDVQNLVCAPALGHFR